MSSKGFRILGSSIGVWRHRITNLLHTAGMLRVDPTEYAPLEDVVQSSLRPVRPSEGFRSTLRDNLALAAGHKTPELIIEFPRPFRGAILLAASASVAVVTAMTILLVLRSRAAASR
jgi:hypothetical protein